MLAVVIAEPLVEVATKDVDLRQLPPSPGKKRPSVERSDQPPSKKTKAEMFDVLFGNEDVDLRQLAPAPPKSQSPPPCDTDEKSMQDGAEQTDPSHPKGWAKYKELQPDTYKKQLSREEKPEQDGEVNNRAANCDRLGRPLLYHRLPDDPRERKRSLSSADTDMRLALLDSDSVDGEVNVGIIISQADEQLKNGEMTMAQYNTLLTEVIRLNEIHKLREAQRRDEQESKAGNSPLSDEDHSMSMTFSPCSDSSDTPHKPAKDSTERFKDIDDRVPVSKQRRRRHQRSQSPPRRAPSPLNNLQPPPWADKTTGPSQPHHMGPGPWEPMAPHPPWHPSRAPMPPHMRMIHPGFHRPPGPEFGGPNNFMGMNRWRPPFIPRAPCFEGEMERMDRFQRPNNNTRFTPRGPPPTPQLHRELPPADQVVLEMIGKDPMRTINIDGVPREIRFYGDTALVIQAWDEPREISFQGGARRIVFDDRESVVCTLGDPYVDCIIDGAKHSIRLGAPTRELFIDGNWYECFFGGQPVNIEIGGKIRKVKLEGPPPQVKIGEKRTDLIAGKINLIINARTMVPVYLDAKPQRFDVEGKPHTLRFINALATVLINECPFKVEFGGLPKPIMVRDKKNFIRFTCLPHGVKAGYINIVNMEGSRLPTPPPQPDSESSSSSEGSAKEGQHFHPLGHDPVLPIMRGMGDSRGGRGGRLGRRQFLGQDNLPGQPSVEDGGHMFGPNQHRNRMPGQMPLEMLTSLMPSVMAPASGFTYQVQQNPHDPQSRPPEMGAQVPAPNLDLPEPVAASGGIPFLPLEINVDELFQKLVATGIVPHAENESVPGEAPKKSEEVNVVKPVDFKQSETLKVRQPGVVALLYSGIQCSSCGVRFSPEQTMKYSQHLDWHFRQNRRDRDNTRKAQSRRWYYDVSDWIQFEEIEDLEERAQSWFETQQAAEGKPEDKEVEEVPSVCAGRDYEDTFCAVCHDRFEQFYNEEREEWHLRPAIRIEGDTFHPLCYEDHKASLNMSTEEPIKEEDVKPVGEPETELKMEVDVKEEKTDLVVEKEVATEEVVSKEEDPEEVSVPEEGVKQEAMEQGSTEQPGLEQPAIDGAEKAEVPEEVCVKEEHGSDTDEPMETVSDPVVPDTTHTAVACSIDGNVELGDTLQAAAPGPRIKININKALPVVKEAVSEGESSTEQDEAEGDASEQPPVPGEEGPMVESESGAPPASPEPPPPGLEPAGLKPRLVGRKLTIFPTVCKGTELSGLCSIM